MNKFEVLSEKELEMVCGGESTVFGTVKSTLTTVGTIVGLGLTIAEISHINEDLKCSPEGWDGKKQDRSSAINDIGSDIHSKIVRESKKGIASCYNKCHNGIVDFLRNH